METKPITLRCSSHFDARAHACFGMSPFNSYFSEERIREIALWGKTQFSSMHFFVPDVPAAYTLEALGYDPQKAAWKARRQAQYLHNKIHRALKDIGYSDVDACQMVLNWEVLDGNARFAQLYEQVKDRFETDLEFQTACLEASRWVLEKRVDDTSILSEETLRSAVRYLLTEIPLFLDSAGIVGKPSSVFCYHQCIRFLEDLYQDRFSLRVAPGQGFIVLEPILTQSFVPHQKVRIEGEIGPLSASRQ